MNLRRNPALIGALLFAVVLAVVIFLVATRHQKSVTYGGHWTVTFSTTITVSDGQDEVNGCAHLAGVTHATMNPDGHTALVVGPPAADSSRNAHDAQAADRLRRAIFSCLEALPGVATVTEG